MAYTLTTAVLMKKLSYNLMIQGLGLTQVPSGKINNGEVTFNKVMKGGNVCIDDKKWLLLVVLMNIKREIQNSNMKVFQLKVIK